MADTTVSTLTECVPEITTNALLELNEGDVMLPLVTRVIFGGPGVVHNTPFVKRLTSEADDSFASQELDSTTNDETSPSAATCGVHGGFVALKDIAQLGSVDDMVAVAGQLLGQCISVRRDLDLVTLATGLTDQGGTFTAVTPADLYDAYGSLRTYMAPLPYNLVLHPLQIWSTVGLISLFDNSDDAIQTQGPGTVGEDFARQGFAGMALGFNLYADANIALASNFGSGIAFSRECIKYVEKRGLMVELQRDASEVATEIAANCIWGEAVLRGKHGNEMQFRTSNTQ
jgi:hypothetical protein